MRPPLEAEMERERHVGFVAGSERSEAVAVRHHRLVRPSGPPDMTMLEQHFHWVMVNPWL